MGWMDGQVGASDVDIVFVDLRWCRECQWYELICAHGDVIAGSDSLPALLEFAAVEDYEIRQ